MVNLNNFSNYIFNNTNIIDNNNCVTMGLNLDFNIKIKIAISIIFMINMFMLILFLKLKDKKLFILEGLTTISLFMSLFLFYYVVF